MGGKRREGTRRKRALASILQHGGYSAAEADDVADQCIAARKAGGNWKEVIAKLLENAPGIIKAVMAILALF